MPKPTDLSPEQLPRQPRRPPPPRLSLPSTPLPSLSHPIPQITFTEIIDADGNGQSSSLLPSTALHSQNSLSPPSPHTDGFASNPVPLTRDLLQKKNKLDKFNHDRAMRLRPNPSINAFTSNLSDPVDERITAGLGISTPPPPLPPLDTSIEQLRKLHPGRMPSPSPLSSDRITLGAQKSPPPSPRVGDGHALPWDHDPIILGTTTRSGSSNKENIRYSISSVTSRTASTYRHNSITKQDRHTYSYSKKPHSNPSSTRTERQYIHPSDPFYTQSSFYLLNIIFSAAKRVVNFRGLEDVGSLEESDTRSVGHCSPREDNANGTVNRVSNQDYKSAISTPVEKRSIASAWGSQNGDRGRLGKTFSLSDDLPSAKIESQTDQPELVASSNPPDRSHKLLSPLQGNSLGLFSPSHPVRLALWHMLHSRYAESGILLLLLFHWLLLVSVPIYENTDKTVFGGQWTHYVFVVIQFIYTVEAVCKIIVYGFWIPPHENNRTYLARLVRPIAKRLYQSSNQVDVEAIQEGATSSNEPRQQQMKHRCYFSGFANVIDMLSIIAFWVDVGLMSRTYPYCSLFKALGAMRPLRLLSIFPGLATILRSLEVSWDLLKDVAGFICFFLLLFALIGLISFKGVFSRQCYIVSPGEEPVAVDPPLYCAGYYNGTTILGAYNSRRNEYSYPGTLGYICSNNQVCLEVDGNNPNYGFTNYDTIYFALLNVFAFVSLEMWTEQLYQTQDGDSRIAALYYSFGIYVLSFILTFLLFAVITSGFSRVRAANRVSAFTGKKKQQSAIRSVQITEAQDGMMWRYGDQQSATTKGQRFKARLVRLVKSKAFFYFGGVLVLLDVAFMCVRSVHASEETLEMIDDAETAFTFLFAFEIIIRMAGSTGWLRFWMNTRNKFDLFLVISTCVIQLPMIQDSPAYKYLTIFQCLRMYRLFICIPRVRRLLSAALGNGESVINVVGFLLWATALCSPIFMQLFGGDFGFIARDEKVLRCDTFWESYLTLIMLYTSEMWTFFLYNGMESQPHFSAVYAALFICIYFAFARYIMSGLYIAVILENFELEDEDIKRYQIGRFIQRRTVKDNDRVQSLISRVFGPLFIKADKVQSTIQQLPSYLTVPLKKGTLAELLDTHSDSPHNLEAPPSPQAKPSVAVASALEAQKPSWISKLRFRKSRQRETSINNLASRDTLEDNADDYDIIVEEENRRAKTAKVPAMNSLIFFSPQNRLRRWCKKLAGSSIDGQTERKSLFNWFIMACVAASIVLVIMDEPSARRLRLDSLEQSSYKTVDTVLGIIFLVETAIRVIADGLILPPNAYLRNHWNRLDFIVVVLNFIALFVGQSDLSRALGTVRSLRILRLIRYFSGMRDVFVDLFHAFPLMLDALLLVFLVMVFFSVYGVNIFGGRTMECNDGSVFGRSECIGEFLDNVGVSTEINLLKPRVWALQEEGLFNYDDFPHALALLFSLSSTEGWVDALFSAMSAPSSPDSQPKFDWNASAVYNSIFYVFFMVISHGTLQLFVGVIIEKFKQRSGISSMTTKQRQYADLKRQLAEIKPTPKAQRPTTPIRRWCYHLVVNKRGAFNNFIMTVVILNICVIASEFQNEPRWLMRLQDYLYLAFIVVYILESIIKYFGLGWTKWRKSMWNWYNAFIALSALMFMVLRFASPDLWTLRIERYCLVCAAFRLGEGIDALQTLYHTVRISLPKIVRVTAVFLVVMCLFAMVFMELFGLTKYGSETGPHSNFRDYGNALLLLIRITTGEAWNVIMMNFTVQAPNCVDSDNYLNSDCGSPGWAYFLFNFFYLVCTHIFLNLFTATVISNFEYAYETRSRFTRLKKDDLRNFKYAWAEVDPNATGYIQPADVPKFLRLLGGRFRITIYDEAYSIKNLLRLSKIAASPSMNEKPDKASIITINTPKVQYDYNIGEVNKRLAKLKQVDLQKRRKEYNMCYLEIVDAATSKGISFDDVRDIMAYRFVNSEEALTIDNLLARLEKLDRLHKAYAAEKATGVFLKMAQRKRYLHQLWQKRNDDEIRRLGIHTGYSLQLDTSVGGLRSPTGYGSKRSPVPTIVIQDAPPSPGRVSDQAYSPASLHVPGSPVSNYSFETQMWSPAGGASDSLQVAWGTASAQPSPFPSSDGEENALLFNSPFATNSPYSPSAIRNHWRLIDGNANMSNEMAGTLMESLNKSPWSDLLRQEDTQ